MTRRVAVTGLGVLAPGATNAPALGRLLRSGRSAITRIEAFDPSGYASKIAGQVSGYEGDWHSGRARWIRMAEDCAEQALADARLDTRAVDPARCGVSIATAVGATKLMAEHFADLTEEGEAPIDVAAASEQLPGAATFNAASSAIADRHGFEGPCSTLTTGCTGGNDALGFAADLVRRGDADVMLAGASEATITPLVVACFDAIGALSVRNDEPERASRPFDADRDGFVLGEGAAVVVLEELEHARARGAHVHCEITGFGSTANAYHMTDLEEHGEDLARSLAIALAGRRTATRGARLRQRPRQLDAAERRLRDQRGQARPRRRGLRDAGQLDQGRDRPCAGRGQRDRVRGHDGRARGGLPASHAEPGRAGRGV